MNIKNRIKIGDVFSRLTIIARLSTLKWLCKCTCGNTKEVYGDNILRGKSKSCGCLSKETTSKCKKTHGMSNSSEYRIWGLMIDRCTNKNASKYLNYGGRGIVVCQRWIDSFENFYADMGSRPSKDHSIDRIDNNGNYEPSNCQWKTTLQQNRNRRSNRNLEYLGQTKLMTEWEECFGLTTGTISFRLKSGWSVRDAIETPIGEFYDIHKNQKHITKLEV